MSQGTSSERATKSIRHEYKSLPRLHPSAYRGLAQVHWIFTIKNRETGYLTPDFFHQFKLTAMHTFARYDLVSPCICLMPDHVHLLLLGTNESGSDQRTAVEFLRKHLRPFVHPFEFQHQAYDHVLRDSERVRDVFQATANYVLENPVRSKLCKSPRDWPYATAVIPGYPDLNLWDENYWDLFWRLYHRLLVTQ
ncbi:MAG: hypothetical protein AAGF67_10435 [Verrucomicrobiota bacterium]